MNRRGEDGGTRANDRTGVVFHAEDERLAGGRSAHRELYVSTAEGDRDVGRDRGGAAVRAVEQVDPTVMDTEERNIRVGVRLRNVSGEGTAGSEYGGCGNVRVVEEHARCHAVDIPVLDAIENLRQITCGPQTEIAAGRRGRSDLGLPG